MHWTWIPAVLMAIAAREGPKPRPAGRLDAPAIREASGLVASRVHRGIFWVHNDSGNTSDLFAVRADGSLVATFSVAAPNVDWEDIATDDRGRLYLGDIGNNDARLPLRAIHVLDEPDPFGPSDAPIKPRASSFYRFADRASRFDAESLFVRDGRAFLIAKIPEGHEAAIYSVPLDPPASPLRPALPELVATLPGLLEPATGADLSADGRLLAISTTKEAWVYERRGEGWGRRARLPHGNPTIEAICWDGDDLLLAGEDRALLRIAGAARR